MKHKHKWQFKEEIKYPVKVIDLNEVKGIINKTIGMMLSPMIIYEYYNIFVCECGKQKEVQIK